MKVQEICEKIDPVFVKRRTQTTQRPMGIVWPLFLILACCLAVWVYGSGNDWKVSAFDMLVLAPMYLTIKFLFYFFLGLGLGLVGQRLNLRSPWLLIFVVGLIPHLWPLLKVLFEGKMNGGAFIFLSFEYFVFLLFAMLGYALSMNIEMSAKTTCFAVLTILISYSFAHSVSLKNFISTRGTYFQFRDRWDDWQQGQSLPPEWETGEVEGIRFILRDQFLGHNNCHGYFYVPDGCEMPQESPWCPLRKVRKMPGGWYEFLSSS